MGIVKTTKTSEGETIVALKKAVPKKTVMTAKQRVQRLAASDWPSDLMIAFNHFITRLMHFSRAAQALGCRMTALPAYDGIQKTHSELMNRAEEIKQHDACARLTYNMLKSITPQLTSGEPSNFDCHRWEESFITKQLRADRWAFCLAAAEVELLRHSDDEQQNTITVIRGISDAASVMLNEKLAVIHIQLDTSENRQEIIVAAMFASITEHQRWDWRLTSSLWKQAPLVTQTPA